MIQFIRQEVRSLPRVYWTLWLGTLVNRAGGFVIPFLALYITARGGTPREAGIVMALYGGGTMLAGIAGGALADRVGRRGTMLLSMFGGAAALLAMGLAPSLRVLGALTFLMGCSAELYRPAVAAAVADVVPPLDRQRAYAHLYWVINLGFAIAPTLAGLLAGRSYFALFAVDAATLFGFGLIVFWRVPETRPLPPPALVATVDDRPRPPGFEAVLRDRVFVAFCLLTFCLAAVMWQNGAALPLDMKHHGVAAATYGALMAENGVLIVLFQPLLAPRLARYSRTAVLVLAALFFGVGFGLYGVVSTTAGYAAAIAVWSFAEIACLPTASAVAADLAPTVLRGRYQGLYGMAWGTASCLGPLVGGVLLEEAGGRVLWLTCFAVMAGVAGGHLLLGPARARREAAAHEAARREHRAEASGAG